MVQSGQNTWALGTRNPVAGSENTGFSHIWRDPYLFLQPLQFATSNLVHNLGSTSIMPKNNKTFRTKFRQCVGLGASEKFWDPLFIFAAAEASDLKFGTQLGSGK